MSWRRSHLSNEQGPAAGRINCHDHLQRGNKLPLSSSVALRLCVSVLEKIEVAPLKGSFWSGLRQQLLDDVRRLHPRQLRIQPLKLKRQPLMIEPQ